MGNISLKRRQKGKKTGRGLREKEVPKRDKKNKKNTQKESGPELFPGRQLEMAKGQNQEKGGLRRNRQLLKPNHGLPTRRGLTNPWEKEGGKSR